MRPRVRRLRSGGLERRLQLPIMRTNFQIDDKLLIDALRLTGAKTKREVVELSLRTLIALRLQEQLRKLKGKIAWEGDLDGMRQ